MSFAISVLFVGVVLALPLNIQNYKLIARQPDAQETGSGPSYGYFSSTMKSTGIENEQNPWDGTYSIIGKLDSTKYLIDGKYTFKLFYDYRDGTSVSITFKQSSWITTSGTPQGFEITLESGDTPQSSDLGCAELKGLGLSGDSRTYIDGNGIDGCWYNSIGSTSPWGGGIPGYNNNVVGAKSMALYIYDPPRAEVLVQCDDAYTASISRDGGATFLQTNSGNEEDTLYRFDILDVNLDTVIDIECSNSGSQGLLIAQINYDNSEYYTADPLSTNHFELVSASHPHYLPNPPPVGINSNAVWLDYASLTTPIKIRFNFADTQDLICPGGTDLESDTNIAGCGITNCDTEYDTIDMCRNACIYNPDCIKFEYTTRDICKLFSASAQTTTTEAFRQVVCTLDVNVAALKCPLDSTAAGDGVPFNNIAGGGLQAGPAATITDCKNLCTVNSNCVAFEYDGANCQLFPDNDKTPNHFYPPPRIVCSLDNTMKCPVYTTTITNGDDNDISGSGILGPQTTNTIGECRDKCTANPSCAVFEYGSEINRCELFPEGSTPNNVYSTPRTICALDITEKCPEGSGALINGDNNDIDGCGLVHCDKPISVDNINGCMDLCSSLIDCVIFEYTIPSKNCELFEDNAIPNRISSEPNRVICELQNQNGAKTIVTNKNALLDDFENGKEYFPVYVMNLICLVVGILLFGTVMWCYQNCIKHGKKHTYKSLNTFSSDDDTSDADV